ncbi:hypothetical protein ES703_123710 [subsurface metagenome]
MGWRPQLGSLSRRPTDSRVGFRLLPLQISVEEVSHYFKEFFRTLFAAAQSMSSTFDNTECCVNARFLQGVVKQLALMKGHGHIFVTVHDKKGWVVFCYIRDGIGFPC